MTIYSKDQYFEAIFQIRPKKDELLEFAKKKISKSGTKIGKEFSYKYGYDLYLSSRKFTLALGKKFKKSFKGDLKISRKLFTIDRLTSKKVYRVTVCFRLKD